MTAINQRGGVILIAGGAADEAHDFLGEDFLSLRESGEEVFFGTVLGVGVGVDMSALCVLSLWDDPEELSDGFEDVDSLFESLFAALLYPSLR